MEISLEHIADAQNFNTFRVAFHSAAKRCLLMYPHVTGLIFTDKFGNQTAEWQTRFLISKPVDDFVLNPGDRISFNLHAHINADSQEHHWVIDLPAGEYVVHFHYHIDRETDWYDVLQKRSRFVDMTPIWRGSVQSNTIPLTVIG